MRSGKRFALSYSALCPDLHRRRTKRRADPPRDPQRPHTGNMELVGQTLRAGAVFGPPPAGPGTVPWDTRNTDLAFWKRTVIQGRYDGFRIIDVSNPRRPRERAHFPCVSPRATSAYTRTSCSARSTRRSGPTRVRR